MNPEELVRAGRVNDALCALGEEVRRQPADPRLRTFLFQLLAVVGQWDRAQTQLGVLAGLEPGTTLLTRIYERLIEAERLRESIATGAGAPVLFGEPESWLATLLHGNELLRNGESAAARDTLQAALDAAPDTIGTVNGAACRWLADADPRFGPVLEAFIEGRHFWVPFFRIKQVRTEPPQQLRDLIWLPAGFQWSNGGEATGFLFARYPGSHGSTDPLIQLGRKTDWENKTDGLAIGSGQRLFASDADDYPALEVRSMEFQPIEPVRP
jgi:type VI secretion system protein ImpE